MESVSYKYDGHRIRDWQKGFIQFWPPRSSSNFKEIAQSKAIPFLELVANVGGFIGILVGQSVLQLLYATLSCINNLKSSLKNEDCVLKNLKHTT